jgi:hypothetical protein
MVLSNWLSVCRWYAVLKFNFIPRALCSFSQNLEVNHGSRYNTMQIGTPCSLTISRTYKSASLSIKSAIFFYFLFLFLFFIDHQVSNLDGKDMGTLRQPVNNNPYDILSARCFWKTGDKIHSNLIPLPHRHFKWLK